VPLEYWLDRVARNGRTAIYNGIGRCTLKCAVCAVGRALAPRVWQQRTRKA
jgi:hypothetical protein